ncbi:GL13222 [Drosophila persimilis]|uniref:GL13222 n=1 Tax=Drosophila persimilis TaxID=7234 RepID=B4IQY7_DROPE|nr:GL13222 [Drosophila persimilis]
MNPNPAASHLEKFQNRLREEQIALSQSSKTMAVGPAEPESKRFEERLNKIEASISDILAAISQLGSLVQSLPSNGKSVPLRADRDNSSQMEEDN